ncbi:DnaJ protein-like protein ANJ1 [Hibiscus syriacus]|uniref:DnaJ protein-like protein ANJ1 n=1 Tax=Hibiscus syriacus TaxID=106335 RepID=A0A6A2ZZQ8_HIBSY|nr:dnaJ protein homolog 2-like [Hibiscus syriacus]KAE8697511.1 DnaJ protein-like protein ANJ1 [Hibiscus syriacus]
MCERFPRYSVYTNYYEVLGVPKTATRDEIKKAYKKGAMKNHPDKCGDAEKFKELVEAYEVLSDPEKRKIYDQYGEDDVTEGMGGDDDPYFPGGGKYKGGRKKRGEDVVHPLQVSLEDLYNGATKKLSVPRNAICGKCRGKGSKGVSSKCYGCDGSGWNTIVHWDDDRFWDACPECEGSGEVYMDLMCPQCKGNKVTQEKKKLKVHIEKGMLDGHKITFKRQANEAPDIATGDIVVVLQLKKHPTFKRMMDDLHVEHNLSLTEAMCGFEFALTHLDGRKLLIKSNPGEVIEPGQYKAIDDEGVKRLFCMMSAPMR